MNEANTKEANANPKAGADVKRGLDLPFFATPGIFNGMTEQSLGASEGKLREDSTLPRERSLTFSAKPIRPTPGASRITPPKSSSSQGANTTSAFDFLKHLLGTKSPSEILQLSATHGRKSFEATTAQSRELWELARKVATETAEPIKKSFASALQKAP